MALREFLLPWDSQPQEAPELNGDYAPAFVWNPAIGLLTPALGNQLSATGTVTQSVGQHGRAANLASSAYLTRANYAPIVTSNGVWTGDFTAFVIANPSASINPRALLSQRLDGGALSQFNIQANANTAFAGESGTVQFSTNSTASTTTSATGIIDGKYHVFGIRRTGTTLTGWVDGVEVATVTGTARAIGSASAGFGIGIAPPIYNILGAVDVAFAAGFNVGIVDMADVSRNVWRATFTPRTIWVPVSAGGSANGNASTAPASSALTAPTATGSGSAQASTVPAGSTLTAPTATASASAQASGALAGASLTAPTATATGTTAGNATATGAPAGLTLTAPTATATGSAQASGAPAGTTLTAPTGTASSAGHATAPGAFSGATLTAPTGTATGTTKAFAAFMAAVLTAPTATASNGEAPVVILGSLAGSRPANEMTRTNKQTATRANVQTATRTNKQTATR